MKNFPLAPQRGQNCIFFFLLSIFTSHTESSWMIMMAFARHSQLKKVKQLSSLQTRLHSMHFPCFTPPLNFEARGEKYIAKLCCGLFKHELIEAAENVFHIASTMSSSSSECRIVIAHRILLRHIHLKELRNFQFMLPERKPKTAFVCQPST